MLLRNPQRRCSGVNRDRFSFPSLTRNPNSEFPDHSRRNPEPSFSIARNSQHLHSFSLPSMLSSKSVSRILSLAWTFQNLFGNIWGRMAMATAMKRLVPLLDRVLVEKIVPPTKTAGGILLPESSSTVRVRTAWSDLHFWAFANKMFHIKSRSESLLFHFVAEFVTWVLVVIHMLTRFFMIHVSFFRPCRKLLNSLFQCAISKARGAAKFFSFLTRFEYC